MRWWNGSEWTDHYRPTPVYIADQQYQATVRMARSVETIKSILVFYLVVSILAGILVAVEIAQLNS